MDPFPPRRLNREKTFERLSKLASASPAERVEMLTDESANGLALHQLVRLTGFAPMPATTPNLILVNGQHLVSKAWVEQTATKTCGMADKRFT